MIMVRIPPDEIYQAPVKIIGGWMIEEWGTERTTCEEIIEVREPSDIDISVNTKIWRIENEGKRKWLVCRILNGEGQYVPVKRFLLK